MKTIFKYELKTNYATGLIVPISMPHDAKYLHVDAQGERIFLWAEVDTESSVLEHKFEVFGTGHEMYVDMGVERKHIGSLIMLSGDLISHVYHRIN